jgi:heme/copper-type cytochrome/quinol oxidase subunit 1
MNIDNGFSWSRWLYSTNCKDIAILYIIFAIFAGLIGTGLSILIRLELAGPNPQILYGNGQLFNVIVSAHAVFMIFFMVMPMSVGFFGI